MSAAGSWLDPISPPCIRSVTARSGVSDGFFFRSGFQRTEVDASCTHMYSPGVKRHIAKALDLGVTPEEIMAVLQLVAVLGIHSVALGTPHLVDEMNARGMPVPAAKED